VFEDPGGDLSIEQIASTALRSSFRKPVSDPVNRGISDARLWARQSQCVSIPIE
jgi:hypothetical protein